MAGMAGELGLHLLAKMLGLPARIMLPSLAPQPVDHRIVVDSRELEIQSKTSTLPAGYTVNTIYGNFKFFLDASGDADYYSFALVNHENVHSQDHEITVYLFAFLPNRFAQEQAVAYGGDRYLTYNDLQAAPDTFSHAMLDEHQILPAEITIAEKACNDLTSPNADDRLLAALDVISSSSDASRVLDMLVNDASLFRAFTAADPLHQALHPQSEFGFQAGSSNASGLLKTLHDSLSKKTA